MVEVSNEITRGIDFSLNYLQREWSNVPAIAQEFAEWEPIDQTAFKLEWSIRDSHLERLQSWAAMGLLTGEQHRRFEELLRLIDRHRPTLERLFAGG